MPTKRLAYVDVTPAEMAEYLGLPEGSEVVGVGWESERLIVQVRSDEVPPRTVTPPEDPEADHKAEHVEVEHTDTGEFAGFRKVSRRG